MKVILEYKDGIQTVDLDRPILLFCMTDNLEIEDGKTPWLSTFLDARVVEETLSASGKEKASTPSNSKPAIPPGNYQHPKEKESRSQASGETSRKKERRPAEQLEKLEQKKEKGNFE